MKINRAKIKLDYRKELKGYHKDIDTLDSEDRSNGIEYAKMYYNYLTEAGIPYARLALAHSYNQYIINSNTPFQLMMSTTSKELASVIWKIDPDRISEIEDDTSMLDSVSSRVFKARAAEHFVPSGEFDYSSSDSEEEEYLSKTLSANKVINKQLQALLSSPDDLKNHQKESFNNSLKDLKLAEEFAPNITKSSLESIAEHNGFIQELIGIKNPNQALEKIKKSEQEEEKMTPVVKDLVQNIKNQEVITQKKKSSNTKEQKLDSEDWLTDIISHTQTAMNDAYNDPDMQQFLQTLGGNSNLNFEDNA